jgi:hypothetical protein
MGGGRGMSKNLKMLRVIIYDAVASLYWRATWENWLGLYDDQDRNNSTEMWIKAQGMKADWCANHVYHGSGWHGLNANVDGNPMVVQVMTQEQHRNFWKIKEDAK